MSRVGIHPVKIPAGVKVAINGGVVSVEGPKGKLQHTLGQYVTVKEEEGSLIVEPKAQIKPARALFGTTRALLNNMVVGVTEGWKRSLEMVGVGFSAELKGKTLTMALGYSHKVEIPIPTGLECKINRNTIDLESCDKQLVGQIAAIIRKSCPPEPYLGKGIKYSDEVIKRKAGKTGV